MKSATLPFITLSNKTPHYGDTITVTTHGVPNNLLKKGTFLCAVFIYQGNCVMVSEVVGAMTKNPDGSVNALPILLAGPGVGGAGGPSPYPNLPGYRGGDATAHATVYTDKGGIHTVVASYSFPILA
jgi:hypothetical protein